MNRKHLIIGITGLLLLAGLAWVTLSPQETDPIATTPTPTPLKATTKSEPRAKLTAASASQDETTAMRGTPTQLDQSLFAQSLQGSDIDGQLRASADGNLVIDLAARDFFDYFLATAGEVGAQAAIDEILRYIDTYLPEPALQQARELFSQYLQYKKFNSELQRTPIAQGMNSEGYIALLRDTFAKQKSARLDIFGPQTNQALFGLEDQYGEYTLQNMSIQNDPDLSSAEKQALMEKNRSTLPIDVQTTLANHEQATLQNEKVTNLIKSELDDTQVYSQLLEQGYEHGKAEQILAYRQQQSSFEQRYDSYQSIRAELQTQDIPKEQLAASLKKLQGQYFVSEQEQTQAKLRDLNQDH